MKFTWNKYSAIALVLIIAITLASIAFLLLKPKPTEEGKFSVHILVGGEEYKIIDLEAAEDQTFSIKDDTGKNVSFEIKDHKIRFVDVTCPDHICEKVGYIYSEGQTAVCLPNQVVLAVEP